MKRSIAVALCAAACVMWLPGLTGAAYADGAAVVTAGSAANNGGADQIGLVVVGGSTIQVSVNGAVVQSIPMAGLTSLTVQGSGDDDTLTVDAGGGLLAIPGGITYDGGSGFDSLALVKNGGPTITDSRTTVGPSQGGGQSTMTDGTRSQTVTYLNLEPVVDLVPAATLTVNGTNAANSINYTQGSSSTNGLVAVDDFETMEFSNKGNLVINGLAGADSVNLNNPSRPTGLTGTIQVNGGDPTTGDSLTVNGVPGTLDNLRYLPSGVGAGTVVNDSANQPNVVFTGIEQLHEVVHQADGDGVRAEGTTGNDVVRFFHGATGDSGTFQGSMDTNAAAGGPFPMTPMTYSGANPGANDSDVNFFNPGGTDRFEFNGTGGADAIDAGGGEAGGLQLRNILEGETVSRLELFNVASAVIRGLGDDDVIASQPTSVPITVQGGDGNDTLNHSAQNNAATTVDLGAGTITSTGAGTVTRTGIERLVHTSAGAGSTLTVVGTASPEAFDYTGTGPTSGEVAVGGVSVLSFTGVGSIFTVNPGAGIDSVTVHGTVTPEAIAVGGGANPSVQFAGVKGVSVPGASTEAIRVDGGSGDVVNIGATNGTAMVATLGNPTRLTGGGFAQLDVVGVDDVNVNTAGGALTVNGTGGDDQLAYTPTGAQSGEVRRNGTLPTLGFTGVAGTFTLDPGAGNDTVSVVGTSGADAFAVQIHGTTTVAVGTRKAVALPSANVELLKLLGGYGGDQFVVDTFDDGSMRLFVDGDLPSSDGADSLKVNRNSPNPKTKSVAYKPKGSGRVTVDYPTLASIVVDYINMESVRPRP